MAISLTIPQVRFLLRATLPAASTDDTRPHLACIMLRVRGEDSGARWIETHATDGHRLHRARVRWQPTPDASEPPPDETILIARSAAEATLKAVPAPKRGTRFAPPVTITATGIETPTGAVRFPTLTERFPDVDRVIPAHGHTAATPYIGANPGYVAEAAEACALVGGRTVMMRWHQPENPLDPMKVTSTGEIDGAIVETLCVLMPMRL